MFFYLPVNKRAATPTLNIAGLSVAYKQAGKWQEVVRGVSLRIQPGEVYGLVGESGSGKTTLALAVLRYLGPNGRICQGKIELEGQNLLDLPLADLRLIWGGKLAYLPQNPQSALNPALRVGEQIAEGLRYRQAMESEAARRRAIEALQEVQIADPERISECYPHQLSGGMQQRAMIAMALSSDPALLILDEPTTNLDATTQAAILRLLRDVIRQRQTAVLYITHNLAVVAQLCQRVGVLYGGALLEEAPAVELFAKPLHPYTQGLLDSLPRLAAGRVEARLRTIEGQLPSPGERPPGCIFRLRCPFAVEVCEVDPAQSLVTINRWVRCHRWEAIQDGSVRPRLRAGLASPTPMEASPQEVLNLEKVEVHFPLGGRLFETLRGMPPRSVRAVAGVDLRICAGQTFGLVGESGSGKTTLARGILGLADLAAGKIELMGVRLPPRLSGRDIETLRRAQMVFQDPEEALNPYLTVREILARPMITLLGLSRRKALEKVPGILAAVRLPAAYAGRLPSQLSGGEKQRVAIGRAFAASPDLLVCDEPVSALDVSVQAAIINLLRDLQATNAASMLLISHDLAVVRHLADTIGVIYLGKMVETADADGLFKPPYHPYTEALLSAIPTLELQTGQEQGILRGEAPSPTAIPGGCPFHTRCPRSLGELCQTLPPPWKSQPGASKRYRCHIPWAELQAAQEAAQGLSHD